MTAYIASDGVSMLETTGVNFTAAGVPVTDNALSDWRLEEVAGATYRDSANVLRNAVPVTEVANGMAVDLSPLPTGG
jgi:hypothetical protein